MHNNFIRLYNESDHDNNFIKYVMNQYDKEINIIEAKMIHGD